MAVRSHLNTGWVVTKSTHRSENVECSLSVIVQPPSRPDYLSDFGQRGERDMVCTGGGQYLDFVTGTGRLLVDAPSPSRCRCKIQAQIVAVAVAAATLAACGGPAVVSNRSEWGTAGNRHPAPARTAKHIPSATKSAAKTSSYSVASFYKDDTETASGEKFDPDQLTAAHRTLPFGTRLRVTNVETGRSVTVRINDRGPYIPGRSVDLSYSAADTIGMVERGVTKVKVEVVR